MTQTSYPWSGTTVGDAGPYTDVDWQLLQDMGFGVGGASPNNGVVFGTDTLAVQRRGLEVEQTGPVSAAVQVRPGAASVAGVFYLSDAIETIAIPANSSGNARIDTIVLQKVTGSQTVRLAHKQGTPAGSPVPPTLTQSAATYEVPLADVNVANGFGTISNTNILPTAEPKFGSDGVYLYGVQTRSTGIRRTGDVVAWDSNNSRAVVNAAKSNANALAGVWVGTTPQNGYGRVLAQGIGYVRTSAAITQIGIPLIMSGSAGMVQQLGGSIGWNGFGAGMGYVGIALETTAGAGLCLAYIDVRQPHGTYHAGQGGIDYGGTYFTRATASFASLGVDFSSGSMQVSGGAIKCTLQGWAFTNMTNGEVWFDFAVNGTRQGTTLGFTKGIFAVRCPVANAIQNVKIDWVINNLTPGDYTFEVYWRPGTLGETASFGSSGFPAFVRYEEMP